MVKVVIAEYSGVCFGVRRALDMLESSVEQSKKEARTAVMLGPLIHNPKTVEKYNEKGVKVVALEDIEEGSIVVVRSHGITSSVEKDLLNIPGISVMDTTCPYVKRIHQLVKTKSSEGFAVIVMGNQYHSEVKGIASRIDGSHIVISPDSESVKDGLLVDFVKKHKKICLVAQTTSRPVSYEKLIKKIRDIIKKEGKIKFEAVHTICVATLKRQDAAEEVASRVDAVVVLGGHNSSNTSKLFTAVSYTHLTLPTKRIV